MTAATTIDMTIKQAEEAFFSLCRHSEIELAAMPHLRDDLFDLIRRRKAARGLVVTMPKRVEPWWQK